METNTLSDVLSQEDIIAFRSSDKTVAWDDKDLAKIVRLRLLSDPDFPAWDVSYVWGVMKSGEKVRVRVPFYQLSKTLGIKRCIIEHAKRDGVFAKGLGIFDAISTSS